MESEYDNPTRDSEQKIEARDKPKKNDSSRIGGERPNNQTKVKPKLLCVNCRTRRTRGNSSNNTTNSEG